MALQIFLVVGGVAGATFLVKRQLSQGAEDEVGPAPDPQLKEEADCKQDVKAKVLQGTSHK